MLEILAAADVFQDAPPELLSRLAARGRRRTFQAGEQLFQAGEPNACLYVVMRGRVRIEWWHAALSEPVVALVLGAGEEIGALGLLDGEPRRETVTAIEETETVELCAGALAEVLAQYPVPAVNLLKVLSRRDQTLDGLGRRARELGAATAEPRSD